MFFQVQYTLRDVDLAEGEIIELSEDKSYPAELVIHRPQFGEDSRVKGTDCLGTVRTEEVVTEKVRPQFEITDDPRPAVIEIGNRVCIRLKNYLLRAVCLMRWRRGNTGNHNPIRYTWLLHWSDDGQTWKGVPGHFTMEVDVGIPFTRMSDDLRASFTSLVKSGASEPLAHQLFHEAWNQRADSPRSSLLTGITAAEVGFKTFVSDLVPHAGWLAFNAPAPPLIQILTEYLPGLPVKQTFGVSPFIPKELLDVMKKGINLRNKTAHAGGDISRETLKEILVAVRDLLYLLDFYCGHDWAFNHVSHDMREHIRSEVQKQTEKSQR